MCIRDRNILMIVVDTLRADRLGCYGYFRDTSPTIDRLAREGVLFEDYYASALSTGAAFTCLHTGLPSIKHRFYATPAGAYNLMNFDDTLPTLAEIIQNHSDYTTVAVDNLINFAGHMKQTVRGYEFYINVTRHGGFPQPEYTAEEANSRFLPWLKAHYQEKFFAFVHLWDPHHNPYRCPGFRDRFHQPPGSLEGLPVLDAPAGYQYVPAWGRVGDILWGTSIKDSYLGRQMDGGTGGVRSTTAGEFDLSQDLYDGSIAHMDHQLQRILDTLTETGILDRTLILLTADHGEGLNNHGIWGHGLPYDDTVHIPLILWRPGLLPHGLRVQGYAQQIDVAPTLLDVMGIWDGKRPLDVHLGAFMPAHAPHRGRFSVQMEGQSLLPHIRGERGGREFAVNEVRRGPQDPGYRTLIQGPWKLIESLSGERQLYNREADPMEKINLAAQEPDRTKDMATQLHGWVAQHLNGNPDPMRVWP
jgi:arylsulfatase